MSTQLNENVKRCLNNFARMPFFNTTMNKSELENLYEHQSDTIYCNGHPRQIKADALTENVFKVYTVPF